MNLVSSKSKKVFLSANSKIDEKEKVDIILSPEFYWLRIFEIPVKTVSQARHVLPTLFEDIVDDVYSLSFQVQKLEENKFLCFAYNNKEVYTAIKNSGLSLSLVNAVYFAQNECVKSPLFKVEGKTFLYTEDNIFIKLYNSVLNSKYIYTIVILALLVTGLNFIKYFSYKNEKTLLDEQLVKIKKESFLPSSIIQTNVILNSYEKKIKKQEKIREALSYVLSNSSYKLSNVSVNKNELKLSILNANKSLVDSYLQKKYRIISSSLKGLVLVVRIEI